MDEPEHVCDRDVVEQTPGYGHCIVRCPVCHRPGIRTFNPPHVSWEDEILERERQRRQFRRPLRRR